MIRKRSIIIACSLAIAMGVGIASYTYAANQTTTKTLSITINAPLAVVTSTIPDGSVGVAYSFKLQASGGIAPYTWSISTGSLPAGLTLASDGTISGTPTASGTQQVTFQVKDSTP